MSGRILIPILLVALVSANAAEKTHPTADGVKHKTPPKRVVALAPSTTEILFALGVGDHVVGVSPYTSYPPEALSIRKIGGLRDPDLEAILTLKPDLVILRGHNRAVEQLCTRNDIAIFHDNTETLKDIFSTTRELAKIMGRTEQADALLKNLNAQLDEVRQSKPAEPPPVLLTIRSPDRLCPITSIAKGSYLHEILELAGAKNIFAELDAPYPEVALEEIIARKPRIIIEAMPGNELDQDQKKKLIAQWSQVTELDAVKTGQIHYLTKDYTLIPSLRAALLAKEISEILTNKVESGAANQESHPASK